MSLTGKEKKNKYGIVAVPLKGKGSLSHALGPSPSAFVSLARVFLMSFSVFFGGKMVFKEQWFGSPSFRIVNPDALFIFPSFVTCFLRLYFVRLMTPHRTGKNYYIL